MLTIKIAQLRPFHARLSGGTIGQAHSDQVKNLVVQTPPGVGEPVTLDFSGIASATASYLKRLLNPFFLPAGDPDGFQNELHPIATHVAHQDLLEDLEEYLNGRGRVIILADIINGRPKLKKLLGRLEGAAAETFDELRKLKRSTAAQLYDRHRDETTNQSAWNNRLAQLVEMRIAQRSREGRFWIYQPTV